MRVTLPFGQGLDRYTGIMQVGQGSMTDIRNLRPRKGKLQVRRGTVVQSTLPDQGDETCEAVCLIMPVRSYDESLAVGYYSDRKVHIFRLDADGTNPVHLGEWFTLNDDAASPPYFTGVETYNQAFIAHDEARESFRGVTQVYDATGDTSLANLQGDLDGTGDADIKFRGVDKWSSYLVGWGFGSASEVRPELVRVSLPAQPSVFQAEHYFIAGDRGSPVTTCKQAGEDLLALKPTSTFRIVGESSLNFGILSQYELFGALSPRLAITVEKTCYAWSFEGPWSVGPEGARDLEIDLDLEGPSPPDLAQASTARNAFAVYIPGERVIEWHFGPRIYVLSLEGAPRWSYRTRDDCQAASGNLLYSLAIGDGITGGPGTAPTGYPEMVSVVATGTTGTMTWRNVSHAGTEIVEIWIAESSRPGGEKGDPDILFHPDSYQWEPVLPYVTTTAGAQQTRELSDLVQGRGYVIAVRYRQGNKYTAGYEADNPNDWPASSRLGFVVRPEAPTLLTTAWRRNSASAHGILLVWSVPSANARGEIYRDGELVGRSNVGEKLFTDTLPTGNREYSYRVAAVVAGRASIESNELTEWAGPPDPAAYGDVHYQAGQATQRACGDGQRSFLVSRLSLIHISEPTRPY